MKNLLLFFIMSSVFITAQAQKTVSVGILTDVIPESATVLVEQLKNEIKTVVGQDAVITFKTTLENNFDFTTAKNNYQELIHSKTDIILSFGAINTAVISQEKEYPKPTIVFGSINSDFIKLPKDQKTSRKNNITYVITPSSYTKDLEAFHKIYSYKNIGILIDEFLINTLPVKELFDSYFSSKDSSYKLIPISKGKDVTASIKGFDAIYLAGGQYLSEADTQKLIQEINKNRQPSFSAFGREDVEKGILATNQPGGNIDQFFRRIALNIEAIVAGTNPSELPIYINYKNKLSINYNTANLIDFPLRYSMLATSDFIGGDIKTAPEFSLSILDIMNGVVSKNLGLKAETKNIDISQQDVYTAKSNYLPDVTASTDGIYIDPKVAEIANGQNPELSTSGKIVVKQLLYSESASANIEIKDNLKKAQQEVYNSAELDALLNASVSYFNALILKSNLNIQNQNLQVTKLNLEIAEQNFEAGATGKSDVLRLRSQLAQNTQSLIEAGNKLTQAFNTINQLLNNPISKKIDIDDAELAKGIFKNYKYQEFLQLLDNPKLQISLIEFLTAEAKRNAPELKNIGYNINAIKRNYKLNDTGRFIPTVALQGQYSLALSKSGKGSTLPVGFPGAPDGTYNVGLNISLPIFQQNTRNINKKTAKIQEDQLLIQQENTALSIEKNINDMVLDIVSQIANIEISKVAEETAKESLDLTQNAYKSGAVPIIQLIDAQTNYAQSQLSSATANYNYLITSIKLERAIGYYFLMNTETNNQAFMQRANQFILNKN